MLVWNSELESVHNSGSAVLPIVPSTVYKGSINPTTRSKSILIRHAQAPARDNIKLTVTVNTDTVHTLRGAKVLTEFLLNLLS